MIIEFILTGSVPPKKNLLFRGKYGNFYRPETVNDFADTAFIELNNQKNQYDIKFPIIPKKVYVEFYQNRKKDLDNLLGMIFDCLQQTQIIKNDSEIIHLEAKRFKDKNERTVIRIKI